MKTCCKCREPKFESEFYRLKTTSDGLQFRCKSCTKACVKASEDKHPGRHREVCIRSVAKDPERAREYFRRGSRKWRERNPRHEIEKRKRDPGFKVLGNLRKRLWSAVKSSGAVKSDRTMALLGCSIRWLKIHLEALFVPGMTWENYGPVWHIDHVRPCAKFDLTDPSQQQACFHWTNLQPLFAADNIRKSDT